MTGPARRPRPPARQDPARRAAYDVLRAVAERDAYANLVLPALLAERRITGRDAAFATELAYGALRSRGLLDAVAARCVDRPLDSVDPPLLDLLRLGAYQILETRVPPHAAVSATVDLARSVVGDGRARFVNAVLRRIARQDRAAWVAEVAPAMTDDPVGHLAVSTSHPRWVVEAFADALGGDLTETAAALAADNVRPEVTLAARPGRMSRDQLLAEVGRRGTAGAYSPYAVRLAGGDPAGLAAVRAGRAGAQDEGSQLAALALTVPEIPDERRWVDLCAGPGGKSALLAGLAAERGGSLLAIEIAAHRAGLVTRVLAGAPNAVVVRADGRRPPAPPGSADRVLVDAPCSGLGALRRRPEARWRREPRDLAPLGRLQRELLTSAIGLVRPGGVVAYVTCSPHPLETAAVVDDVLATAPGVERLDAVAALGRYGVTDAGAGPYAQLWPHRHGTDAMFVALLRTSAQAH